MDQYPNLWSEIDSLNRQPNAGYTIWTRHQKDTSVIGAGNTSISVPGLTYPIRFRPINKFGPEAIGLEIVSLERIPKSLIQYEREQRQWQIAHHQARKKSIEDARARYKENEEEMPRLMHCVNDVHRRRGGLRSPVATRGRGYHTDGRPGEANEEKQNDSWRRMWNEFRAADMYWAAFFVGILSSMTCTSVFVAWNLASWLFGIIKDKILHRRLNLSSYVAKGFAEALLFSHYRINILEEINDLTVLYNHAQQWAKYTKIEKETCVKAFIQQRVCQYIAVPDYPITTCGKATEFLKQSITCYVNCLRDDQELMEKYKLLCLRTLTELKYINAPASFDPKLVAIALYAEDALKSTVRWTIDNQRLLEIQVLEEDDEESAE